MIRSFKHGLATGLILQLAVGPVFLFVMNLAVQRSFLDGLAGAFAAMTVDALYMGLAVVGIGKLLERQRYRRAFGFLSSATLIAFGILLIEGVRHAHQTAAAVSSASQILASFSSVFLLTVTNPLTIVFYTGVFASKAIEYRYARHELTAFGIGTALATPLFMGTCTAIFTLLRGVMPVVVMQVLNVCVGCLLIGYGLARTFACIRTSEKSA